MKQPFVMLVLLLLSTSFPATAVAADAHAEAVALLEVMNARARYHEVVQQMEMQLGVEAGSLSTELLGRIFDEMARIYSEVYSAEELAAIREFYISPAGKAFLQKQALLTEKYVEALKTITTEYFE